MTCPICHKPSEAAHRPFCSRRCSEVDLGRWLTGGYVLPAAAEDDEGPSGPGSDDGTEGGAARLSDKGSDRSH